MDLDYKNIFKINLIISALVILAVYILQYIFNLAPCEMCIKERYPYYIIVVLSLLFFLIKRKSLDFLLLIFTSLTIFIGTIYTMKHVGIERKLIEGQTACSSISDVSNTNDLLSIIQNAPIIRCDEPTLILNIISLAELNLITMSVLLMLNLTCIYYNARKR